MGCATYTEIEIPDMAPSGGRGYGELETFDPEKSIRVTWDEGNRIEGKAIELTASDLVLITSPNYGEHEMSIPWEVISKIETIQDPPAQGFLVIGSVFGVLVFSTLVGWISLPAYN